MGTGGRSWMFIQALVTTYRDKCELAAFCDTNQTRMNFYNRDYCNSASLLSGRILLRTLIG
jgi:hypothetical protein